MLALPPNETMQRRGLESLESPNPGEEWDGDDA